MNFTIVPWIFLCVGLLIIITLSILRWRKVKKFYASINISDYTIFKDINIGSDKHFKWKQIWGYPTNSRVLINKHHIIFLPSKWSLLLFHTELPVWIKKDINPPIKMKFNFKNEISITIPYTTWLSENTIINYILETKNLDQKKEIVQALKSWM